MSLPKIWRRCAFYTAVNITLFGRVIARYGEGHEAIMRQALLDFEKSGYTLPSEVDPDWLTLGNVRTDVSIIELDRKVPFSFMVKLIWTGIGNKDDKASHAMRQRNQTVAEAYKLMHTIICEGFKAGCNPHLDWKTRALRFGSALHTLQDSYCTGHAARINNGDPYSPLIDMYTYPSRQHPITTSRDNPWQDKAQTVFKPEAAAAISATVAALRIFAAQTPDAIDPFFESFLIFRDDIATH